MSLVRNILATVVMGLWLAPALAGAVDMACWFATEHACTSIPWDGFRTFVAAAWIAVGFFPAMVVIEAIG